MRLGSYNWGAGGAPVAQPAASEAAMASAAPRALVTSKRFDGLYHEIFNEADAARVFKALADWLAVAD